MNVKSALNAQSEGNFIFYSKENNFMNIIFDKIHMDEYLMFKNTQVYDNLCH